MWPFGPPDIHKLEQAKNIRGLIKALRYRRDPYYARMAAWALARLRDPHAVGPLLCAALKDSNPGVAACAAGALGSFPDPKVVGVLSGLVGHTDDEVSTAACKSLGAIGGDRAVELLCSALSDQRLRKAAAEALGKTCDPRAIGPLCGALSETDTRMKAAVRESLAQIGSGVVDAVRVVLRTGGPAARESAAEVLGRLGDVSAVADLCRALDDRSTRCAAADALGSIGDVRAYEPLVAALEAACPGEPKPTFQMPWNAWLSDEQKDARAALASALGKLGDPRAVDALLPLIGDPFGVVRIAAARALAAFYKEGKLNEQVKSRILEEQKKMAYPHQDHKYESFACGGHADVTHIDAGIGVSL